MKVIQLTPSVSISDQITAAEVKLLKQQGVELLINNRPDNEETSQPSSTQIAQAAAEIGLNYCYIPMSNREVSSQVLADYVDVTNNFLTNRPSKKIHLFCRTGARSSILWANAQKQFLTISEIITIANHAGIDVSVIAEGP